MGQSVNNNFSLETQYEVVTKAGKLPLSMVNKLPNHMSAADQHRLSELFDEIEKNDIQFKSYLKKSIETIDDREDVERSRQLEFPVTPNEIETGKRYVPSSEEE